MLAFARFPLTHNNEGSIIAVSTETTTIGFVGVGNMGAPMVRCLAHGGYDLVIHDLRRAALDALAAGDGSIRVADGFADIGRCPVVITMLPDAAAVRTAVLGDDGRDGFAAAMARGSLVVDMSSSAPGATLELGQALAPRGIGLVDAPVSGGVPRAVEGRLTIMAGGDAQSIDAVEPMLSSMGTVHRTGALGSGHAMKALNNYVSAAGLLAVCEALIIAARFGLDPRVANDVLKASTGRNNTTDRKVEQYMLNRAFDSGFALDLMRKDVGIARGLAADLRLDAPWLRTCEAVLDEATRALGPDADHTAAFAFLQQRLTGGNGDSDG